MAQGIKSDGQGESPSQSGYLMVSDKAAFAEWRKNFDLHVLLLMKKHKLSKAVALVQAYHEGVDGLNKRLG